MPFLLLLGLAVLGAAYWLHGERPAPPYAPQFSDQAPASGPVYLFGIHPLHNEKRLFEVYQPLVDYLNQRLPGARLRLESSRDYAAFEQKLAERRLHFALPNPYQVLASQRHGYRVFAKVGDDERFRGLLLVRKDSGIEKLTDLRGKAVSYPAPTALAATIMPQWLLHRAGVALKDLDNRYVGSQESSIMNVYLRNTAAGATWPAPWKLFNDEHPEMAAQLTVKWQTEPLVNNGLVARDDVPPAVVKRIAALLVDLAETPEGPAILGPIQTSRFEPADDRTYAPVREFLTRFEREVRPIEASR